MAQQTHEGELNEQQRAFCREYIIDFNATRAAIAAGYSEKSARVTASRLLTFPNIKLYLNNLIAARAKRVEINADTILHELLKLATVDITQAFTPEGWLKPLEEIPEEVRKAIAGLEVQELFDGQGDEKHIIGVLKKVKFYDKTKSLELLGKHLKLFTDKIEHSGKVTLEDLVSGSMKDEN